MFGLPLYVLGAMLVFTPAPVLAVTAVTLKASWWLLKTGVSAVVSTAAPKHEHMVWTSSNTTTDHHAPPTAPSVTGPGALRRTRSL